jgi:hypothetical protein
MITFNFHKIKSAWNGLASLVFCIPGDQMRQPVDDGLPKYTLHLPIHQKLPEGHEQYRGFHIQ